MLNPLVEGLERWVSSTPERVALESEGRTWTWAQLAAEVDERSRRLEELGVRRGDRVGLWMSNSAELVFRLYATARVGTAVLFNARLLPAELQPLLTRSRARVITADPTRTLAFPNLRVAEEGPAPSLPETPGGALLFTSGTTGSPKAALLPGASFFASARASAENLGGDAEQRWLGCLPLFHVGGLAMLHRCAVYGATLVLQPRFDVQAVSAAIDAGVTHLSLVPTGLTRLLDFRPRHPVSALRAVLVGGGPVAPVLLERARGLGFPVLQTYGLTEACSQVATERLRDADGTTAGPPLTGTRVRIVDADGRPVDAGVEGEIEVLGPTLMAGYDGDPDATARAFRDGWLRTHDLGRLDANGRLTVLARRTDLILTGGENVYPAEIEQVLALHPGVADCCVVGVEDAEWGQRPIALVELRGASHADVLAFARENLAGFKVPKRVLPVGELPRFESGKLDRRRALELARALVASAAS